MSAPRAMSVDRRRFIGGLASKLVGPFVLVVAGVAVAMIVIAATRLADRMTRAFESRGEAIALALAAAAEQSVGSDLSMVQGSVDANKSIDGVSYIFLEDRQNLVSIHTFSPQFPPGLGQVTREGQMARDGRVRVARDISFTGPDGRLLPVIDVAAPVAGGALGTVHVGMDRGAIEEQVVQLQNSMALSGGLIALAGILACWFLAHAVAVRPIRALTRVTDEIVRKGDLTQTIAIRSGDEIGQLAATFGAMVEKLREIPRGIRESTRLLAQSVDNLRKTTNEQVEVTTRQATALQETQVTAQEIKQTSILAAEKAEAILKYAERADAIRAAGEAAVQQSLRALTDIGAQVSEIAGRIGALTDRTTRIGEVTQTVKELADQSNMLALNAAIEAVRSGEHGKGFAIVAREIRSLADQSIQGTVKVREMLEDISAAIRAAVSITEKGAQRIEGGLVDVRTLGGKLTDLSAIVKEHSVAVRQIGAAVGQQNAGISQIFGAVTEQNRLMEETTKRLDRTEGAVKVITDVSRQLVDIVDQFRV
jgi:methyl-accepting chemotaxis protein